MLSRPTCVQWMYSYFLFCSYTFERVQENSEKVWRFYRYHLIHEYFDRPTLAPPLIILSHIKRLVIHFKRKCHKVDKPSSDFREYLYNIYIYIYEVLKVYTQVYYISFNG